jgi:uncharacterized protein (TIGR03067 family)
MGEPFRYPEISGTHSQAEVVMTDERDEQALPPPGDNTPAGASAAEEPLTVLPAEPEPAPAHQVREEPRPVPSRPRRFEKGSLRLFRLWGIDVFLHWSWFIAAYFQFHQRPQLEAESPNLYHYSSPTVWFAAEYLALFLIVLLHEFGHALACRSVGGRAERIYLWPLGGIAFVNPPPRPGPFLWSIVAGPLVNVLLVPLTAGICLLAYAAGLEARSPDLFWFLVRMALINALLLLNLLPIYPLDGGQILQGLLWFIIGRAHSLLVVTILALPVGIVLGLVALAIPNYILAAICGFSVLVSLAGLARARLLLRILNAPRRQGFRCPACGVAPPIGVHWVCSRCQFRYDTFAHGAICPRCGVQPDNTMCPECHQTRPFAEWSSTSAVPANTVRRPVPPAFRPVARTARPVPLRARALWAGLVGGLVLGAGLLLAGPDHLIPVIVVALGGVMLGATQAEAFGRAWQGGAARSGLRGTWRLVELDGKDLSGEGNPVIQMTITGYAFTERTGGEPTARGSFWLDPSKEPSLINIIPNKGPGAGTTFQGIYEVKGKVWRVCVAAPGAPRPTTLTFEPERQRLMVYRRE